MATEDNREMLLGRASPVVDSYAPQLLYPLPRKAGRSRLGLSDPLPFTGADLWHAYEISGLDGTGKPQARVGRFIIPADTPCMVESKSFKLYLNSLNNTRFDSQAALAATLEQDVAGAVGGPIEVELLDPADPALAGTTLPGTCLDNLPLATLGATPDGGLLRCGTHVVEEQLFSHLLRSLCPVTGQPDWASVWVHYRGRALAHDSLLAYLIAYRQHQEFHEQCVERMFRDIYRCCDPQLLHVQAFYTRRGGLDINPMRSTDPAAQPLPRLDRQ